MLNTEEKLEALRSSIKEMENLVVAFSGGVDSSLLLKVAYDVLGDKVLAVTARSSTYPEREYREAVDFAAAYKIRHRVILSEELAVKGFSVNPINRCYLCKFELFSKIKRIAAEEGYRFIAEGSNNDDMSDYRPGLKAISELGILTPLKDAGLIKDEIRSISKKLGLATWNKPSFACLASRFPYGDKITVEKLKMVDSAEQFLIDLGFRQNRVRHHGDVARIEISEADFEKFMDKNIRNAVHARLKKLGFIHISLDILGYRTGSLNEGIDIKEW